ncbi:MAG: cysteine--tRNA ligase [Planctomycetota bacterium]|jgi:cysteinyl-tRNA synthetase|nr:cysteine--tRNA ligase [Planctomycetota bacterium]
MTTSIRIYNTLTKTKETFQTVEPGKVGMYLCGPTVYAEAHIGHMVGPVIFDTIKRYLQYSGYEVTWVVNITDVDDKLINKSREKGISMFQLATQMTADYLANLQSLGVDQIDHMPRATENMDEIIKFIVELIDRGFAYASQGDVYFDVLKDEEYGRLSNRTADAQQGEGGETASRKRSTGDFALWKSAKPDEPSWPSPWGNGRPGWHIECSAMSRRILGKTFDIHGGGLDLVFPHHENELAQSRCCHGQPMVRYWLHNGLMRADAEKGKVGGKGDRDDGAAKDGAVAEAVSVEEATAGKISRSKGGGGLAKLIERQTGERIRFFLLRSHYRSTTVFGDGPLEEAGASLETFYRLIQRFEKISGVDFYDKDQMPIGKHRSDFVAPKLRHAAIDELLKLREDFLSKMDDDFNTGGATGDLFEMVRALNRFIDSEGLEEPAKRTPDAMAMLSTGMAIFKEMSSILGIFVRPPKQSGGNEDATQLLDGLMQLVIQLRSDARAKRDFATSDSVRNGLTQIGITLQDGKNGTTWEVNK